MYFQKPGRNSENPGRNSKNLEEVQKTWKKFPKICWPPCHVLLLQLFLQLQLLLLAQGLPQVQKREQLHLDRNFWYNFTDFFRCFHNWFCIVNNFSWFCGSLFYDNFWSSFFSNRVFSELPQQPVQQQ